MAKSSYFPLQDVLEVDKTPKWFAQHLDFAEQLFVNGDFRTQKMNRLYEGYNGKIRPKSLSYLTHTYGEANKNKYIDYRAGKTKIDILHGEFLKIPLKSTVRTINSDAVVRKLQQYDLNLGAAFLKDDITKLRENGADPLEGMPIEDPKDPNFKTKIKPKDRYEIIMQRIIDALTQELGMVEKVGLNFLDATIVARMFGQIVIDEKNGSIDFERIDPRDGIWFEFDSDPFLKKSFLFGRREKVSLNEVIMKYDLTDEQRQKLNHIRDNWDDYYKNPDYKGKYSLENGEYTVTVIHIEWMGMKRTYTKKSPKTKTQMEFSNPDDGFLDLDITAEGYEKNKAKVDKDAKRNGQDVITVFTKEIYQARRIGHDLDIDCGLKPFTMKDEDTGDPLFSYTGCIVKPVDGESVSMQEIIENWSSLLNVVMYMITRDMTRMKGKLLAWNKGANQKGSNTEKMLYDMLNEGLIILSTEGNTNFGGRDSQIADMLKEYDLGLSASFPQLVQLKNDLILMLDLMTGVNNERTGDIQPTSTVTNAMQAIEASRTITEALFYYTHVYTETVMMKLAETAKIVWGIYKPEKLRTLLGDDDAAYIQDTEGLADQKYGVYLTNGRREEMLKQKIEKYAEAYANSKELTFPNLVEVLMSDSLAQIKNVSLSGWESVQKMREMELNKQLMAQNEASIRQSETAMAMARENREDLEAHDIHKIVKKGEVDIVVNTAKSKNQAVLDTHNRDLEENSSENLL